MNIREYLKSHVLLLDGAMGTYYAEKYQEPQGICELANLRHPDRVLAIHQEYIKAGARAIRTNTFAAYPEHLGGAEQETVIRAGWDIARKAAETAKEDVFIFADIGPAAGDIVENIAARYCEMVRIFAALGAKNFIFETLSSDAGIREAVEMIRQTVQDAFIIVSFGIQPDGFSREGAHYRTLLRHIAQDGLADVTGLNCVSGARHMAELLEEAGRSDIPLCALPNVGYPTVLDNRTYYDSNPEYFARQIKAITEMGISIVGGCCGTTPKHIGYLFRSLHEISQPRTIVYSGRESGGAGRMRNTEAVSDRARKPGAGAVLDGSNRFYEKLEQGKKVIAVELDSPKDSRVGKFMDGARELLEAGADALTIADCPVARARLDSSLLACKVRRELDVDVLPHMTCRDRNINATKALLLGIHAERIRNVLVVTGDPIPSAERDEVRSVYQFNSVKFSSYIRSLNEEVFDDDPIRVFCALNLNAINFEAELKKGVRKQEAGAYGFLTQPVLTGRAADNLKRAREVLDAKILGGIIPVVSERNARFMESEVNGINVSEELIARYHGKNREEAEKLAFEISCEIAEKMQGDVDGYYLITPFSRTGLIGRIIREIRS